jgi:hypothetical protein
VSITSDHDPLILPFPPTEAIALVVSDAQEEGETDVPSIANHFIGLILDFDVLPFVPILEDVHGDEMEIVIGNLIMNGSFAIREEEMTHFAIKKTAIVGGRGERTVLVTPEDVVGRLLWDTLLPEMPVRPRDIEEMINDEVDDLDLDLEPSDLDVQEEALTEEIERMVTERWMKKRLFE